MKHQKKEGVSLVLGAGNQAMLTAIDTLHSFFMQRRPVLVKHHPLRPHLIHPYRVIFDTLVQKGYVTQILDEGIEKTKELLQNPNIATVHVTGAYETACAIEQTLLQTRSDVTTAEEAAKMVTSELGCATPWIIPPAKYTETELKNAARGFVTSKKTNGGANCLCGQVIVMPKEWAQKNEFRQCLTAELGTTPKDPVYYPGSLKKRRSSLMHYEGRGESRCSIVESSLCITEEDLQDADDDVVVVECGTPGEDDFDGYSMQKEAFGPVVAIVELSGETNDPLQYMEETAAPFLNDKSNIFGTLSCTLLWPESISEQEKGKADEKLTQAIALLKYGTIAINQWSIFGYTAATMGGTWGGHPREVLRQSGAGQIGNHYGLPVEKTVVYASPLTKGPILDKNNAPPAIVYDCLHAVFISPTNTMAAVNVLKLLVARFSQYILPKFVSKPIFGAKPYGSCYL